MAANNPRHILVTGAGGFVGQALVRALAQDWRVTATDRTGLAFAHLPNVTPLPGDLTDPSLISEATAAPLDAVVHLATIPGGAAEADPAMAALVNVAASMTLIDAAAAYGNMPRILFASSIAVFGDPLPPQVDDDTPLTPMLRYGAHKLMVEEWIATMTRRGAIRGLSLRLPGIVARPKGPSGMKSAFLSDLFHDLRDGRPICLPVSLDATCWLLSRRTLVGQIVKALALPVDLPEARLTLPALRIAMRDLIVEVARHTGADPSLVSHAPDVKLEAAFGCQPPLSTTRADALGLHHDGSLAALVANALADL